MRRLSDEEIWESALIVLAFCGSLVVLGFVAALLGAP